MAKILMHRFTRLGFSLLHRRHTTDAGQTDDRPLNYKNIFIDLRKLKADP